MGRLGANLLLRGVKWRYMIFLVACLGSVGALIVPTSLPQLNVGSSLQNSPLLFRNARSQTPINVPRTLTRSQRTSKLQMSSLAPVASPGIPAKLGSLACVLPGGVQLLISKMLGYCIFMGSFFLQLPQLLKIFKARSVTGISLSARYSEVPINSSTVIYHFLLGLPLSTYGENIVVLFQNLALVLAVWIYREPRVPVRSMVFWTSAFLLLCAVQLALPPALLPLLIYINIPFGIGSALPQIIDNAKQGHTGQLAMLTCLMKLAGCTIRLFTTVTQIGLDPGLLLSYATGAILNLTLLVQGWIYREETGRVLAAEAEAKAKQRTGSGGRARGRRLRRF